MFARRFYAIQNKPMNRFEPNLVWSIKGSLHRSWRRFVFKIDVRRLL